MTDLLIDRADSGEVPRFGWHPSIVDTDRLDLGGPTRPMNSYLATAPAQSALRRQTDEHAAIEVPHTWIYPPLASQPLPRPNGPTHPPIPPPPPPSVEVVAEEAQARPRYHRPRHRRPVAAWALLLTGAVLVLLSQAGASLAALAVLR